MKYRKIVTKKTNKQEKGKLLSMKMGFSSTTERFNLGQTVQTAQVI